MNHKTNNYAVSKHNLKMPTSS